MDEKVRAHSLAQWTSRRRVEWDHPTQAHVETHGTNLYVLPGEAAPRREEDLHARTDR